MINMLKSFAVFSVFSLFPPFRYHDTLWAINKIVNNQNLFAQNKKSADPLFAGQPIFVCIKTLLA